MPLSFQFNSWSNMVLGCLEYYDDQNVSTTIRSCFASCNLTRVSPRAKTSQAFLLACCHGQGLKINRKSKIKKWFREGETGEKKQRGQQLYYNSVWNNQIFLQQNYILAQLNAERAEKMRSRDSSESTMNLQPIPAARGVLVDLLDALIVSFNWIDSEFAPR